MEEYDSCTGCGRVYNMADPFELEVFRTHVCSEPDAIDVLLGIARP